MYKTQIQSNTILLLAGLGVLMLITSCVSTKKFIYFNDLPKDSSVIHISDMAWPNSYIQKDDILDIRISGKNEVTAADFNKRSENFTIGQEIAPQYIVDKDGNIDIYMVGKIHVDGLSEQEVKEKISKAISSILLQPAVSVRIVNFRFTVIGEVKSPGSFSINHEKISVLEALGFAGDMTNYSKRNNVKIYRDSSGVRQIGILDFNSRNLLNSPFFYLKRNDVILVDADIRRRQANDVYPRLSLAVSALSGLFAIYVFLRK